ncbi:MAG: winged helix-turn-helix transcriptional regulator [Alphaproteobacteria bacterium]|nr:winged helix-turn-helix transcriptional regulator [Alphaproteobacteria bacterium]
MNKPTRHRGPRMVHRERNGTSRLFAMAFGQFFQRVCHIYRTLAEGDIDLAIIASAAAISGIEGSMRDETFRREFADMQAVVGEARQRGCNALSIAEATGLPRETVRRKMKRLVDMGFLVHRGVGDYVLRPGVMQSQPYSRMLEDISTETLRLMNDCLEQGIFVVEPPEA